MWRLQKEELQQWLGISDVEAVGGRAIVVVGYWWQTVEGCYRGGWVLVMWRMQKEELHQG